MAEVSCRPAVVSPIPRATDAIQDYDQAPFMQIKLKVVGGKSEGQIIPLAPAEFIIGRAEECHLRAKSDAISRRHCRIVRGDGIAVVEDLGSRTGTFLNDEKIEGKKKAKTGDVLRIGPLTFEMIVEYEIGGQKREKVKDIKEVAARTAEKSTDRDDDVTAWLSDDDDEEQADDADVFNLDEIKVVKSREEIEEERRLAEEKEKKKAAKGKPKKQYGKLPVKETQGDDAKDTRDAATDMLKKMFSPKKP
jgi:pSer/pThr/pTyr-binding forkhead associated (FHA) protein